jgi:predicted nucleic acid-binding protein
MAISWLFEDERTEAAEAAMRRTGDAGAIVPSLWRLEVANVLRTAVRRGRCDEAFTDAALGRLDRLPIAVDSETDERAWRDTRQLSRGENLTLYDSCYLELAIRRSLPLASADQRLIEAAKRKGVGVLAP